MRTVEEWAKEVGFKQVCPIDNTVVQLTADAFLDIAARIQEDAFKSGRKRGMECFLHKLLEECAS